MDQVRTQDKCILPSQCRNSNKTNPYVLLSRRIVSVSDKAKRLRGGKQERRNLLMRNLYLDLNLNSDSIIPMKSGKCVKNYKWLVQVEELFKEKLKAMPISKQVPNSFKKCSLMYSNYCTMMGRMRQTRNANATVKVQRNLASLSFKSSIKIEIAHLILLVLRIF